MFMVHAFRTPIEVYFFFFLYIILMDRVRFASSTPLLRKEIHLILSSLAQLRFLSLLVYVTKDIVSKKGYGIRHGSFLDNAA